MSSTEPEVIVGLTKRQADILGYVLTRAQEDSDFFDQLAGNADHHVSTVFRMTLSQCASAVQHASRRGSNVCPQCKKADVAVTHDGTLAVHRHPLTNRRCTRSGSKAA